MVLLRPVDHDVARLQLTAGDCDVHVVGCAGFHRTLFDGARRRVIAVRGEHEHLLVVVLAVDGVQRHVQCVLRLRGDDFRAGGTAEQQAFFVAGDLDLHRERHLVGLVVALLRHTLHRVLVAAGNGIRGRRDTGDAALKRLLASRGGGELHPVAFLDIGHVRFAHVGADDQAGIVRDGQKLALRDVAFAHIHAGDQSRHRGVNGGFAHLVLQCAVTVAELGSFSLAHRGVQLRLQLVALLRGRGLRRSQGRLRVLQRRACFFDAHARANGSAATSTTSAALPCQLRQLFRAQLTRRARLARLTRLARRARLARHSRGLGCSRRCRRRRPDAEVRGNAAGDTLDGRDAAVDNAGAAVGGHGSVVRCLRLINLRLGGADGLVGAVVHAFLVGVERRAGLIHLRLGVRLRVGLLLLLNLQLALQLLGVHGGQELLRLHAIAGLDGHLLHLGLHRGGDVHGTDRLNGAVDHDTVGNTFVGGHGVIAGVQARPLSVVVAASAESACAEEERGGCHQRKSCSAKTLVSG